MTLPIPARIEDVTAAWLTEALRSTGLLGEGVVKAIDSRIIGVAVGFLDGLARIRLTYDGPADDAPASVIVKCPAGTAANRDVGTAIHAYEREIRFYREIAPRSPIRLARCYYTAIDLAADRYILVLEDLSNLRAGDQVAGLHTAEVYSAANTIGKFHAYWWESPDFDGDLAWLPRLSLDLAADYRRCWPQFVQLFKPTLTPAQLEIGERVGRAFEWLQEALQRQPRTIVHGDFRADNMLLDDSGRPDSIVVLDWQIGTQGMAAYDLARMVCGSMEPAERAGHEMEILRQWHNALLEGGVRGYSFEQAVEDYKVGSLYALFIPVIFHDLIEAGGDRGMQLAHAMRRRFFAAVVDQDAGSVLPA